MRNIVLPTGGLLIDGILVKSKAAAVHALHPELQGRENVRVLHKVYHSGDYECVCQIMFSVAGVIDEGILAF